MYFLNLHHVQFLNYLLSYKEIIGHLRRLHHKIKLSPHTQNDSARRMDVSLSASQLANNIFAFLQTSHYPSIVHIPLGTMITFQKLLN